MNLAIITYDANHLKTAQVSLNLAARAEGQLTFFALPFMERKPREVIFNHRPDQRSGPPTRALARYLDAPFYPVGSAAEIPPDFDHYLITGAPLLPEEFVLRTPGRVINAHPGIIPICRGLDAFKWSIIDGVPLGNTLHIIDAETDAGEVLAVRATPVFDSDDLATLAARHYEQEIDMLSNFASHVGVARPRVDANEARPARMRMPREVEQQLEHAFGAFKVRYAEPCP